MDRRTVWFVAFMLAAAAIGGACRQAAASELLPDAALAKVVGAAPVQHQNEWCDTNFSFCNCLTVAACHLVDYGGGNKRCESTLNRQSRKCIVRNGYTCTDDDTFACMRTQDNPLPGDSCARADGTPICGTNFDMSQKDCKQRTP